MGQRTHWFRNTVPRRKTINEYSKQLHGVFITSLCDNFIVEENMETFAALEFVFDQW